MRALGRGGKRRVPASRRAPAHEPKEERVGRVEGKVAIITGGGRGQGAAEAELFAREGAAVAVCDVLEEEGRSVARAINESGGAARFFPMDVKDEAHWRAVVDEVLRWKGRLTTLVNNAGIINRMGI